MVNIPQYQPGSEAPVKIPPADPKQDVNRAGLGGSFLGAAPGRHRQVGFDENGDPPLAFLGGYMVQGGAIEYVGSNSPATTARTVSVLPRSITASSCLVERAIRSPALHSLYGKVAIRETEGGATE